MAVNEIRIPQLDYAARSLAVFLSCCRVWPDGTIIETKEQVARIGSVSIHVFSREHMPPHFHVRCPDQEGVYKIEDCERIKGNLGVKEEKILKYWHNSTGKQVLIEAWRRNRPGEYLVGEYDEATEL